MKKATRKMSWYLKVMMILLGIVFICFFVYSRFFPSKVVPQDDEIFVQVQLNIKEDIGLLIYDYEVNDHIFSEGIANADKSLLKHDGIVTLSFSKDHLKVDQSSIKMKINFRVITQYVDPNYENIYPEELTKSIDEFNLHMEFGKIYYLELTGDAMHGYQIREINGQ